MLAGPHAHAIFTYLCQGVPECVLPVRNNQQQYVRFTASVGGASARHHHYRSRGQGETNVYTISKQGQRKLIYQCPWRVNGEVRGLVELSAVIPEDMPHYVRG